MLIDSAVIRKRAAVVAVALCACQDFSLPESLPSTTVNGAQSSAVSAGTAGTMSVRQATNGGYGGNETAQPWVPATGGTAEASGTAHGDASSGGAASVDLLWQLFSDRKLLEVAPNGNFGQLTLEDHIAYVAPEGATWCAQIYGDLFQHAPDCNWFVYRFDTIITYRDWSNTSYVATLKGKLFTIAPLSDVSRTREVTELNYTSNNANWTMRIK